jgi:RNA polymerase-associated protein RTF1
MIADGFKVQTRRYLVEKCDGIHKLLNRDWTDADINEKLRRQNRFAGAPKLISTINAQIASRAAKGPKALIAEKRAERAGRAAAAARHAKMEREAAEKAAAKDLLSVPGGTNLDELFGSASDVSRTATPADGVNTPQKIPEAQIPLNGLKVEKRGVPTLKRRIMDDEVIGALDLGIDIDI